MKAPGYWIQAMAIALTVSCVRGPGADAPVKIQSAVAVAGVQRVGINLGFRTSWGAEQLMSNVLMNPGFEGVIDRGLVNAAPLDGYRFLEQASWLGRADDFWVGATFQIRTGTAAGYTGTIASSKKAGAQGLPEFTASAPLPPIQAGDRIALTQTSDEGVPTQWWIPTGSAGRVAVVKETRPLSPGARSVELRGLAGSPSEIHSYLDAIGSRGSILLPIAGPWQLSFWGRAPSGANLSVRFSRSGGRAWVDRTIALNAQWRQIVIDFEGGEEGGPGILDLGFQAWGDVLLDDAALQSTLVKQGVFRREVVDTLATLRPGYLRDWQGQLGETLENRLAPAEGRRASRYRPGGDEATDFDYSLPEFLDLCRELRTTPWIVVPTTFSDAEWAGLGRYLVSRAAQDQFSEILLEFGNENWNSVFGAAGIADAVKHADAAGRGFSILLANAGSIRVRPVLNAQFANPASVATLAGLVKYPAVIAVAPYFFREQNALQSSTASLQSMFDPDGTLQAVAKGVVDPRQEIGVYEINLHTTVGDAMGVDRAPVVAGAASGSALAVHLMNGLASGIRRQCVYVLAGLDFTLPNNLGYTPLWGVVRDLGLTTRLRPTGLALAMMNQAVAGDLHTYNSTLSYLTVAPFRTGQEWSVIIASSSADAREVKLQFPESDHRALPVRCLQLRALNPLATNEQGEEVTIAEEPVTSSGGVITLRLPAYGLAVLLPGGTYDR